MEIDNRAMSNQQPDAYQSNSFSFGHKLKQARVSKNLSLDEVAGKLFILRRHLEALEAEDFKELPQIAFARGFVVNYSKLLGLDPDQMVDSFNAAYPEELKQKSVYDIQSPLKPMGTLQREGGRSWRINPLLVLGAIGVIIFAVFLMRTISNARDTAKNDADSTTLVDDLSDNEQSAGASLAPPAASGVAANDSPSDVGNTGSAINLPNDLPNNQVQSSDTSKLAFWVTGDITLNVTDATGKSLAQGSRPRGGYDLVGKPPFQIQISDISKVTLNMDNEPVNLEEFAEGNVADFTLPR